MGRSRKWFDEKEWDLFWKSWDEAIQRIPDLKREALEAMGEAVLQEVREQISRRGVNDPQGRVARWQEMRMGSPHPAAGPGAMCPGSPVTGHTFQDGCFTAGPSRTPERSPWRKPTGPWTS